MSKTDYKTILVQIIDKMLINEFLKKKNVGAIASTSNQVTNKMLRKIDFDKTKVIVEYGSGKRDITKQLLTQMREDATLFVFEINEQFINNLSKLDDKRLVIIRSDAEKAQIILKNRYGIEKVDYIISTIPFTFFSVRKRRRIIFRSYAFLKENGKFITSQYSWLIYNLIKKRFSESSVKISMLNVPPVFIFEGIK